MYSTKCSFTKLHHFTTLFGTYILHFFPGTCRLVSLHTGYVSLEICRECVETGEGSMLRAVDLHDDLTIDDSHISHASYHVALF